jgi:hypothetical protein
MTEKLERVGMGFLFLWLVANVVGWVAAQGVWSLLKVLSEMLPGYAAGFLAGATIGAMQWLVLRGYIIKAKQWIVATIVAWGIGLAIMYYLSRIYGEYGYIIGAAITGAIVGLGQWLVLRSAIPRTWLLIPINTLGLAISLAIGVGGSIAVLNWSGLPALVGMMALGGMLYAVISGFALMLLIERALWRRKKL